MYSKMKNTKMNENHLDAWNNDRFETCLGSSEADESELSKNLHPAASIAFGSVDAFSSSTSSY